MFGFQESREALRELPEDWRKRAVEMARGRQIGATRGLRKACTFAGALIVALLLLAGIVQAFGLPILLVQVGVIVIGLLGSVWILTSTFRESARVQIEVVRELQQQLGQVSPEAGIHTTGGEMR